MVSGVLEEQVIGTWSAGLLPLSSDANTFQIFKTFGEII